MNKRVRIVIGALVLAALLLAAGLAVAQPLPAARLGAEPIGTPSQPLLDKEPAAGYAVQPGTAAGGAYQLKGADWSVRGTASGGNYQLDVVNAASGTGTPCCCSYLPCLLKGYR
jgi:hypothetical protein